MTKRIIQLLFALVLTVSACYSVALQDASAATASKQAVEQKADALITTAKGLIGQATYSNSRYKPTYPYQFSCATFLFYLFEKHGVDLATYNEDYMIQQGVYVPRSQLQKGDLLFFKSKKTGTDPDHVGLYIGNNQMIHMADAKQHIIISNLSDKPYYTENYVTARRVLPTLLAASPATKGDQLVTKAYALQKQVTIGSVNKEATKTFTAGGFIAYTYRQIGVSLGTNAITEQMKKGKAVAKSQLQKGDLVFLSSSTSSKTPTMVAIYAGEHRLIIPTAAGVITRVLLVDYYKDRYITARRLL